MKLSTLTNKFPDVGAGNLIQSMLRGVYDRLSSQIFVSTAIAIGTTTTKVKTAATTYGVAGGVPFTKAATDDAFTLSGVISQAKYNVYCLFVAADGTCTAVMGTEGATLNTVVFPAMREKEAMIGYVIVTKSDAAFTGGTTALNAANVTATYVNTVGMVDPAAVI